ncbi:trypsin-7-like [Maniola jurtina]|uniref:trypsin-7-like n=1 Tax=Maniola jurtina TaxID=191418 RepID=UPI001E688DFE|nr:trypsin-7-like [Maniola jurtina]
MFRIIVFLSVFCYVSNYDINKIPKGLLTPTCVANYYQVFITRTVPLRSYHYFHEVLQGHDLLSYMRIHYRWRIVGGQRISIEEAPFQVMYGKYCGGAILTPYWVLTAAHCTEKHQYVYAGSTRRSETKPYTICAHFVHPLWNTTHKLHSHDYDYQLLLLETPIPISNDARPIAIGTESDIRPGIMVSVSGWGHLHYKKSHMQEYLHRVYVPIMSQNECKEMPNGKFRDITPRMFCAGYINGTKDSCQGDSGGPAVYNGKLVGLVSFGVGCAEPLNPGVYSNVPLARDWIRSVTGLPL